MDKINRDEIKKIVDDIQKLSDQHRGSLDLIQENIYLEENRLFIEYFNQQILQIDTLKDTKEAELLKYKITRSFQQLPAICERTEQALKSKKEAENQKLIDSLKEENKETINQLNILEKHLQFCSKSLPKSNLQNAVDDALKNNKEFQKNIQLEKDPIQFEKSITDINRIINHANELIDKAQIEFSGIVVKQIKKSPASAEKKNNILLREFPNRTEHKETQKLIAKAKSKKRKMLIIGLGILASLIIALLIIAPIINESIQWEKAVSLNTEKSYDMYLFDYPDGKHTSEAKVLKEDAVWDYAKQTNKATDFATYLYKYKNGKYIDEAEKLMEIAFWEEQKKENTLGSYVAYLRKYPTGKFVTEAKDKKDDKLWENARKENSYYDLLNFIDKNPGSKYIKAAQDSLEPVLWSTIINYRRNDIYEYLLEESYKTYLKEYPNSIHSDEAKDSLESILWKKAIDGNYESLIEEYIANCRHCKHIVKAKEMLKHSKILDYRTADYYTTITIGNQRWLAENMRFETSSGSWCYKKNEDNCSEYGRFYTFEAAKKACPEGWHLPSSREWQELYDCM